MNKAQSARRLQYASGQTPATCLNDTFSTLIQEAAKQRRAGTGSMIGGDPLRAPTAPRWPVQGSAMLPDALKPLLRETHPTRRLSEIVLQKAAREEIREFVSEVGQTELLRSHSLEPRHTVLLIGPPGTGKTTLASALATELALPFLTVRYEGLVGSYLGETASRLQEIVDYVSRMPSVLFFDEFDSVGKERADAQETGEIKRVVSALLLHMDALPSHCIVVCATNHPELLDRAVWRRFELRIELPKPGPAELKEWYVRADRLLGGLGMTVKEFIDRFIGETFSEIEAITLDARRKVVLSKGAMASQDAFKEAIARWERRRKIGGAQNGSGSDRTTKPRARKAAAHQGAPSAFPKGDLLS